MDLFQSYEIKQMDGEMTVILDLNMAKEEFSTEFGLQTKSKQINLEKEAEKYIRSIFPKLKIAKVHIMVDTILISSFPLQKNKSYRK
ncbi:hypothetical protein HNQ94_003914 [Salirhabdus euzebyi]|uniref:Uncharacterized protein n=1 Tax=Salirhabdus euzebyi TaxID=394506 RepID=A0A841QAV1_9BACI|nr:hypothetical protein [Salirhabdus euzebyi]MBB6455414.1 hypothetical protein [Salirhabdus euzebyi]